MRITHLNFLLKSLCLLVCHLFPVFAFSQVLPEGEGRDAMLTACTSCHGLDRITNPHRKLNAEEWEFHLYDMIARGAPVYEKDIEPLRRYLIDNYAVR